MNPRQTKLIAEIDRLANEARARLLRRAESKIQRTTELLEKVIRETENPLVARADALEDAVRAALNILRKGNKKEFCHGHPVG